MSKKKSNLTFDTLMSFVSADTQTAISEGNIQQIRLTLLRPDRNQPRQLLPENLALDLDAGAKPTDIVIRWCAEAKEEFASPALVHNIRELTRLADSIAQHGLINPVTVRLSNDGTHQYTIITGERRYWAHVLLLAQGRVIQEGSTQRDPSLIPAIIAPEGVHVRAHQLVENLLREDMNAIEKARGIWALRRELSLDSDSLVPWKQVDGALGVSRQHRNRMVAVLELPEEAQSIVVEYSLTERTIRPIVQMLKDKPDLQVVAIKQLASLQQTNEESPESKANLSQAGKQLVNKLLRQTSAASSPSSPITALHRKLTRSSKLWGEIDAETRATLALQIASGTKHKRKKTVDQLTMLREQVDSLLKQIDMHVVD